MAFFRRKKKDKEKDIVKETIEEKKISKEEKYSKGLKKTKESFVKKIRKLATSRREIDENYFKDLEETLIMADIGVQYSIELVAKLKSEVKLKNLKDAEKINELIFKFLFENYTNGDEELNKLNIIKGELNVILVTGVNGVGKTTTIGKLTKNLMEQGYSVSLAAADTFRAGAVAQLQVWAERNNTDITLPSKEGQDPASVVFEAITNAKEEGTEVLLVDTAGRLQNKEGLMKELEKIHKIIERETGKPAIESLLVLDATSGQNGVVQASGFNEVTTLTGIILTKMDSTSKGGIILSIKDNFDIPVKFIGLGEGIDDLEKFDVKEYMKQLTGLENEQDQ